MITKIVADALAEAESARAALVKAPAVLVGTRSGAASGDYLANYSICLLNRQIDIFDDSILLLNSDRIPSACLISRGMIETYAFAQLLAKKLLKTLTTKSGTESANECLLIVLAFTNSSRFKVSEQKKMHSGIFKMEDYALTEQAVARMESSLADSEHVLNALRSLYREELDHTGEKESQFEILYDALSEWVHPSQTSVFHCYTPETHLIHTSQGDVHLHDAAKLQCARALHFITDSLNIHYRLLDIGREMTKRERATAG